MSSQAPSRPLARLKVKDLMTSDVIVVNMSTPFKRLEQLMAEHRISAVPVVDSDGSLVGIVSEADLLLKAEAAVGARRDWGPGSRQRHSKAEAQNAGGLMSSQVLTIAPTAPLAAAARLMRKGEVKRLPVVDEGRLVGIISRADVLKSYLRADADILRDVVDGVIQNSMMLDPETIDVAVEDGVVRIAGAVDRHSDIGILVALTLGVEGVIAVEVLGDVSLRRSPHDGAGWPG